MGKQLTVLRASIAVIGAVADREGVDPTSLSELLHDAIDPEALDTLFTTGNGRVAFSYLDYEVTVDSRGEVLVESPDGD